MRVSDHGMSVVGFPTLGLGQMERQEAHLRRVMAGHLRAAADAAADGACDTADAHLARHENARVAWERLRSQLDAARVAERRTGFALVPPSPGPEAA